MCGVCGILSKRDNIAIKDNVKAMSQSMQHRGPDESGEYFWNDDSLSLGLGHRRLCIIDLKTGRQPIHNEDKSIWIVHNGEVYNFKELRETLVKKGHRFYTQTDTEVIVHSYEEYGVDFIKDFNGMFAFVIWDQRKRQLVLVRDRLGIKPLYYYLDNNFLAFSSEIRPLLKIGQIPRQINFESVNMYLTLRYVPGSKTIFKDIYSFPAATLGIFKNGELSSERYWQLDLTIKPTLKDKETIDRFSYLLGDAVKLRMISDVPIGAYLSGGLDSSTIVALMRKFSRDPINTFCIGFGTDVDEFVQSRDISKLLGTYHHEFKVDKQSFNLLTQIVSFMDEPIGDAIIIPTYLLNKEAAKEVKVALTGEGADEILAGYIHHSALLFSQNLKKLFSRTMRRRLASIINILPLSLLNKFFAYPASLGYQGRSKLSNFINSLDNNTQAYLSIACLFNREEKDLLYSSDFKSNLKKDIIDEEFSKFLSAKNYEFLNKIINLDMSYWLPDYTLLKQDRLSMANSIEGRVPFLDHRIVELCAQLAVNMKIRGSQNKFLLRQSSLRLLPKNVAMAKKKAFYFPTEKCFSEDFSKFVKDVLSESAVKKRGIYNFNFIKNLLANSRSKELLNNKQILSLLILEIWMREFLDKKR